MILETKHVAKPWGVDELPLPFKVKEGGRRIGEIWFEPPENLPNLLVKYIFTSEKLSVQVHPSDLQTIAMGIGLQGKEECWLILDAEPGASVGIGTAEEMDEPALRRAVEDGSIEEKIVWYDVQPGDFFYIPANTIHAIGAGVSLIEVQQNSDITYRLFDYGRPRDLHLKEGLAIAIATRHDPNLRLNVSLSNNKKLVDGPYFRLDWLIGQPDGIVALRYSGPLLVIPKEGTLRVGEYVVRPGQCAVAENIDAIDAHHENTKFLIAQSVCECSAT